MLADEPTAALDTESGHVVMEILGALAHKEHRAVIIVTHDSRLRTFADRVLLMEDGRLGSAARSPRTEKAATWTRVSTT